MLYTFAGSQDEMEKHAPAVKAAMDNLIVPKERWIFAA